VPIAVDSSTQTLSPSSTRWPGKAKRNSPRHQRCTRFAGPSFPLSLPASFFLPSSPPGRQAAPATPARTSTFGRRWSASGRFATRTPTRSHPSGHRGRGRGRAPAWEHRRRPSLAVLAARARGAASRCAWAGRLLSLRRQTSSPISVLFSSNGAIPYRRDLAEVGSSPRAPQKDSCLPSSLRPSRWRDVQMSTPHSPAQPKRFANDHPPSRVVSYPHLHPRQRRWPNEPTTNEDQLERGDEGNYSLAWAAASAGCCCCCGGGGRIGIVFRCAAVGGLVRRGLGRGVEAAPEGCLRPVPHHRCVYSVQASVAAGGRRRNHIKTYVYAVCLLVSRGYMSQRTEQIFRGNFHSACRCHLCRTCLCARPWRLPSVFVFPLCLPSFSTVTKDEWSASRKRICAGLAERHSEQQQQQQQQQ